MVESRSMVRGESPGSGPSGPCPGQQLAAHAVELTDMPPAKAAQEGAQGGWRLDHAAENTDRPTGAQRIGVVNAVAASQGGGDQRQHLVPRVRPSRRAAEVKVMVDEFPQAQCWARVAERSSPALATRRWSSKTMRMRSGLFGGSIYWVLLVSGRVSVPKPLSQIQRSTLCLLQGLSPRPSLGGFGFTQATLSADIEALAAEVEARVAEWDRTKKDATRKNAALHAAREGLHDMAERCRDLTKQIDLAAKLAGRAVDIAVKKLDARDPTTGQCGHQQGTHGACGRTGRRRRSAARARYSVRQADWLQESSPTPNCAMSRGW